MSLRHRARSICNKKTIKKKLPILEWLPKYNLESGICDLIAGITVGFTVIPQAIAYALIANLPPQYGLYSSFMGCFLYVIFGSSKDVTVGPTAIMSLMTAEHSNKGPAYAVLLSFTSGIIITLFGLLRLGVVIDFISVPVIAGFTSAAAITIASGQVKSIFGLEIQIESHIEGIIGTWVDIVNNFQTFRVADTIMGLLCIVLLLYMRKLKNVTWFNGQPEGSRCQSLWAKVSPKVRKVVSKFVWLFSISRNAIIVVVCTLLAYGFDPVLPLEPTRNTTFILTGNIEDGLPDFRPPPFNTTNEDTGESVNFSQMLGHLGSALIIIPLIAILENIAIAKAFSAGKAIDANQEMIALGICNLGGSFVQAYPTTGSFSRTAVNSASGVRTTLGGVYTGALVLLALTLLMPYCAYIPKASLAAVIITAVIFSVEYEVVRPMWRSKRLDLVPAFVTFLCCLFWALEYGILVGVAIQIGFVLYGAARPQVIVDVQRLHLNTESEFMWICPDRALIFPSINYVRNVINKAAKGRGNGRLPVVLDCSHISSADFTTAKGFKSMISDFKSRQQPIIFYNTHMSVLDTFIGVAIDDVLVAHSLDELHQQLHDIICGESEATTCCPNDLEVQKIDNNSRVNIYNELETTTVAVVVGDADSSH